MTSEKNTSVDSEPRGFWSGLLHRELNISNEVLQTWLPGFGTFCWFLYLLVFAGVAILFYASPDQFHASHDKSADAGYFLAVLIALNAGTFLTLYLATLADGAHTDERDKSSTFALSLQAAFVQAIEVAGILLCVIGRYVVDHVDDFFDILGLTKDKLFSSWFDSLSTATETTT